MDTKVEDSLASFGDILVQMMYVERTLDFLFLNKPVLKSTTDPVGSVGSCNLNTCDNFRHQLQLAMDAFQVTISQIRDYQTDYSMTICMLLQICICKLHPKNERQS